MEELVPNKKSKIICLTSTYDNFHDFPDEVLLEFSDHLPIKDLFLLECVNKRFNSIAKTAYRKVNLCQLPLMSEGE
jgi:hypothetical protein